MKVFHQLVHNTEGLKLDHAQAKSRLLRLFRTLPIKQFPFGVISYISHTDSIYHFAFLDYICESAIVSALLGESADTSCIAYAIKLQPTFFDSVQISVSTFSTETKNLRQIETMFSDWLNSEVITYSLN